jgi:two-component system sensor histidine kinase KdpD
LAGRLNRNWYAVYVQTPDEEPTVIDAHTQRLLSDTLTLANQLGATVFTFKGQDVADTILRFAREYRVANVIIGRPHRVPWWKRLIGEKSVAEELIHRSGGVTVIVVDADAAEDESPTAELPSETLPTPAPAASAPPKKAQTIGDLLSPGRIVVFDDPASKADIFQRMARTISDGDPASTASIVRKLQEREGTGSTFLNEGIALPHARIEGLSEPQVALGLTHQGVLDAPTEKPIEAVFMLLTPFSGANTHLQLLARAARLLQSRDLRRRLSKAATSQAVLQEIRTWEGAGQSPAASTSAR